MMLINYSYSEIMALIKKATRGAGFAWGEAEEMAQSTKILAQNNLPVLAVCVRFLDHSNSALQQRTLQVMCRLCDDVSQFGYTINHEGKLEFTNVIEPLLLTASVCEIAQNHKMNLQLCYADITIQCLSNGCIVCNEIEAIQNNPGVHVVHIKRIASKLTPHKDNLDLQQRHVSINFSVLQQLQAYAQRTYVAETEYARITGAGELMPLNHSAIDTPVR